VCFLRGFDFLKSPKDSNRKISIFRNYLFCLFVFSSFGSQGRSSSQQGPTGHTGDSAMLCYDG
jgi:hypothetical protein